VKFELYTLSLKAKDAYIHEKKNFIQELLAKLILLKV